MIIWIRFFLFLKCVFWWVDLHSKNKNDILVIFNLLNFLNKKWSNLRNSQKFLQIKYSNSHLSFPLFLDWKVYSHDNNLKFSYIEIALKKIVCILESVTVVIWYKPIGYLLFDFRKRKKCQLSKWCSVLKRFYTRDRFLSIRPSTRVHDVLNYNISKYVWPFLK